MRAISHAIVMIVFMIHRPVGLLADDFNSPKPVPQSRQAMLEALEQLKSRDARLPLPEVSDDTMADAVGSSESLSRQPSVVNNSRMRAMYLPEQLARSQRSGGQPDGASGESYRFATELFWIVSRVNNCHYCLGHQEDKLLKIGVPESTLLSLDTDWSGFTAKQQAALGFAKKLTYQPHEIQDADIDAMREHFTVAEVLEIAFLVGRYNATNRWTDSLGIPQESHRRFDSRLPAADLKASSIVAVTRWEDRPVILDYQQWIGRLELEVAASKFREQYAGPEGDIADAVNRLLVTNKYAGSFWVTQLSDAKQHGELEPVLKAKIAFVAAIQDKAWDMQDYALRQLAVHGVTPLQAFGMLKADVQGDSDSSALAFVEKLTAKPQSITDEDIARLQKHFGDAQIAEIVYHTGLAAILNRLVIVASIASSR